MTMDDFAAHRTENVKALLWERGFIRVPLGGGTTGAQQPCDGALNQHVRRKYALCESNLHIRKMRLNDPLPTTQPEECMDILSNIWSDSHIHVTAAKGFLEAGLSNDLGGYQEDEITKEARAQSRTH